MPKRYVLKEVIEGPYAYDDYGQFITNKNGKVADMRGFGSLISEFGNEKASLIQDQTGLMIATSFDITNLAIGIINEHAKTKTISQSSIDKLRAILEPLCVK